MALTKTVTEDKIEIVGDYKHVQIRTASIVKEDGKELSRSFERRVLTPGTLKGGSGSDKDTLIETDLSSESTEVKSICEAVWSNTIKTNWTAHLVASKTFD